jgi:hypothetical protein
VYACIGVGLLGALLGLVAKLISNMAKKPIVKIEKHIAHEHPLVSNP